jgi:hypothetical protein
VSADVLFYRRGRGRRSPGPFAAIAHHGPLPFQATFPAAAAATVPAPAPVVAPGAAAAPKPPVPALVIQTRDGAATVRTRLPLDAGDAVERLLPRQAREHLAQAEIDLPQLLASVREGGWTAGDEPLLHIQEGETEIRITLE